MSPSTAGSHAKVFHTLVGCGKSEVRAQCIVDQAVGLTLGRDYLVEFWNIEFSTSGLELVEGAGLQTVPELLLIIKLIRYFKFHRSASAFPAKTHSGPGWS